MAGCLRLACWALSAAALPAAPSASELDAAFRGRVRPLLQQYCQRCHNAALQTAGIDFSEFGSHAAVIRSRPVWVRALRVLREREMPPSDPQPTVAERQLLVSWIDDAVNRLDWAEYRSPGSVTISRLNRAEYNNTIRDLTGLDLRPADSFPHDSEGESGFRNDRDALFVAPLLVEKYLAAADEVVDALLEARRGGDPLAVKLEAEDFFLTETNQGPTPYGLDLRNYQQTVYRYITFPQFGRYRIRVRAWGVSPVAGQLPGLTVRVAGRIVGQSLVLAAPGSPQVYEFAADVPGGSHRVSLHWFKASTSLTNAHNRALVLEARQRDAEAEAAGEKPPPKQVVLSLDWIAIEQDLEDGQDGSLVWIAEPGPVVSESDAAKAILERFASRAYRRPPNRVDVENLLALYRRARERGDSFAEAVGLGLRAALVSPKFLYRSERGGASAREYALDGHELASRLSYFLWMSMPDEELAALASSGRLLDPPILRRQVRRMIADPKSKAFTSAFIGQWLGFDELGGSVKPDDVAFPEFTPALAGAMLREAALSFDRIVREGRSLQELLSADYTYLNEDLAEHYGIPGVQGRKMRLVSLDDDRRGGALGWGAVLTATSLPTRTSPVVRGKWVLETMLGQELPPPPPDAGELAEAGDASKGKTLRQVLELHRDEARCAVCHDRIDPIGFGLENFDAIGRWRETDNGQPVDAEGVLPDGTRFDGPAALRRILLSRREQFARTVAGQMLKFALGRDLEYYDEPTVRDLSRDLARNDFGAQGLVAGIVASYPFRYRQGLLRESEEGR